MRLAGGQARPPLGLTPRGALLLVVMFALAAAAVYPLRQYVSQADRIQRLQDKQRASRPRTSAWSSSVPGSRTRPTSSSSPSATSTWSSRARRRGS